MKSSNNIFIAIKKFLLGFSVVGVLTTIFSLILLFITIQLLKWDIYLSYVISYSLSILLSYLLNSIFVFKIVSHRLSDFLMYVSVYIISMLVGVLLLFPIQLLIPNFNAFLQTVLVIPFTFTWNFIFSNKILNK